MARVQKKTIAAALGISAGLVSRYAKAGMPVTDIASAARWKQQNVRPRVTAADPVAPPPPSPGRLLAAIRQLAETTDPFEVEQLRLAIAWLPDDMRPRIALSVETWGALLGPDLLAALDAVRDPGAAPLTDDEAAAAGAALVAAAIAQPTKEIA